MSQIPSLQKPINWGDLQAMDFPEPRYLVYPWLTEGNLAMLHSWRGVGKTFFALGLAQAVASGSQFLKWGVNPGSVLYFDCEMGKQALHTRFAALNTSAQFETNPLKIQFFSFEDMGGLTWNLSDANKQDFLQKITAKVDLIIIDNLSAAVRPIGNENFQRAYFRFRDWMLYQKSLGKTFLLVHHSGKTGLQRGISDIEDPLDIVFHLRRPDAWCTTDGTLFEMHFQKTRGIDPSDPTVLEPIAIELKSNGNSVTWNWQRAEDKTQELFDRQRAKFRNWKATTEDENDPF